MLTYEQKQTFIKDGYLVLNELLSEDLLDKILQEAHLIAAKDLPTATYIDGAFLEFKEPNSAKGGKLGSLRAWGESVLLNYPSFANLLKIPTFTELLQELVGFDFQLVSGYLILFPPSQYIVPWHKDGDHPDFPSDQIIASIHLQNLLGLVRLMPGSHQNQYPLNHVLESEIPPGEVTLSGEVLVPNGTVVINHANLWHTSNANNSDLDQWLFVLQYARSKNCVMEEA